MLASLAPYLRPPGEERITWEDGERISKNIDCVLTTSELLQLHEENQFDLPSAPETNLNSKFSASSTGEFGVNVGSSSGGYAEFILRAASKEILGVDLPVAKGEKVLLLLQHMDSDVCKLFCGRYDKGRASTIISNLWHAPEGVRMERDKYHYLGMQVVI
ncbi:Iron hydrogenase [Gracilaria domingensis]|nr:Iron hydrogenase [Gracilaria domingensis]